MSKQLAIGIVIGAALVMGLCLALMACGILSDLTGIQGGNYATPLP